MESPKPDNGPKIRVNVFAWRALHEAGRSGDPSPRSDAHLGKGIFRRAHGVNHEHDRGLSSEAAGSISSADGVERGRMDRVDRNRSRCENEHCRDSLRSDIESQLLGMQLGRREIEVLPGPSRSQGERASVT